MKIEQFILISWLLVVVIVEGDEISVRIGQMQDDFTRKVSQI